MSDRYLRRAQRFGLQATFEERSRIKVPALRAAVRRLSDEHMIRYSDTSSLFSKSWFDVLLTDSELRSGRSLTLVVLRRNMPAVMASYQRLRVWDFPNSIALRWNIIPSYFPNQLSRTQNLTSWETASSDELLLGALIVSHLRLLEFSSD